MTAPVETHRPGPAARSAARLGGQIATLDTRRLQIRAPRIYDFAAYAEILCSDRARHVGGPLSRAAAWAAFTQGTALWLLHGHGLWTIDAQTAPSAGFVELGFDYDASEPDLGILLAAESEGQGYAREALVAVRGHAFGTLGWDRLVSRVSRANSRARLLMKAVGARRGQDCDADGIYVYSHVPDTEAAA